MFRPISITAVANGFMVQVGCQMFVYETVAGLLYNLKDYLSDPEATEKRMRGSAINMKHTLGTITHDPTRSLSLDINPEPTPAVAPAPYGDNNYRVRTGHVGQGPGVGAYLTTATSSRV